ncbi:MAG: CPBP family intramembrane metalloprotease [Proteobacteria bacterium]|nr:CPBP family intramembrane metalloprotease [Pseudomonadota bacterium]
MPEDGRFSRPARAVTGALCLYIVLGRQGMIWPFYLLFPLLAAGALAFVAGFGRDLLASVERGRLGRVEWALVALITVVAAFALVAWTVLFRPDLSRLNSMLPPWPLPGLIAAGLAFSAINAVLEEAIWRGVLQRWLLTLTAAPIAVAVRAVSFGALHYGGFPSGWVGMGLAGVYGLMIGALALRSKGLLAPVIAHIAADLVIFTVVASSLAGA